MTLEQAHAVADRSYKYSHGEMLDAMDLLERETDGISMADAAELKRQLEREDVI